MSDDYHALLARREAMRLRDRLLAPASRGAGAPPASYASPGPRTTAPSPAPAPGAYDGAADQELIVRNLGLVTPFDALITHLYDAMFERHPYLRKLFPESMEFQRTHLGWAFRYLIENLDRPEEVDAFCTRLGRDHRKLGVLPVHYEVFETALREALRRYAGGRLGADVTEAWLRMVRLAAAGMVRGANEALAEPAYWTADVTAHERRGRDVAVLRVRPSAPYPYRPGQYATLQTPLLPLTWRPYSMAGAYGGDGELEFHIRRTGPDGVSDALVTDTGVGDTLRLGPAQGTTVLDGELTRDVLVVAGGTGWATAKALLEDFAARRPPGRSAHLFLGARGADDLYDAPALDRLESRCPWLRVVRVLADGPDGRPGHGSVVDALARHGGFDAHTAYISGPPAMVTATAWHLTRTGLPPTHVHHDPLPDGGTPVHRPDRLSDGAGGRAFVRRPGGGPLPDGSGPRG